MQITKRDLKRLKCCESGISKFMNTPALHNIDDNIKSIIIKYDMDMFSDFVYFLDKIKKHIVNQIKYESSNGSWTKFEYDSNGNLIKSEDSNGFWYKYEYDSNRNQIKYEDSNGFWNKYEYDSNRNRIKYENSYGVVCNYNIKSYDMSKVKFIS
jgi:YD repeat-containing protein